jgi:hypothetical protein
MGRRLGHPKSWEVRDGVNWRLEAGSSQLFYYREARQYSGWRLTHPSSSEMPRLCSQPLVVGCQMPFHLELRKGTFWPSGQLSSWEVSRSMDQSWEAPM